MAKEKNNPAIKRQQERRARKQKKAAGAKPGQDPEAAALEALAAEDAAGNNGMHKRAKDNKPKRGEKPTTTELEVLAAQATSVEPETEAPAEVAPQPAVTTPATQHKKLTKPVGIIVDTGFADFIKKFAKNGNRRGQHALVACIRQSQDELIIIHPKVRERYETGNLAGAPLKLIPIPTRHGNTEYYLEPVPETMDLTHFATDGIREDIKSREMETFTLLQNVTYHLRIVQYKPGTRFRVNGYAEYMAQFRTDEASKKPIPWIALMRDLREEPEAEVKVEVTKHVATAKPAHKNNSRFTLPEVPEDLTGMDREALEGLKARLERTAASIAEQANQLQHRLNEETFVATRSIEKDLEEKIAGLVAECNKKLEAATAEIQAEFNRREHGVIQDIMRSDATMTEALTRVQNALDTIEGEKETGHVDPIIMMNLTPKNGTKVSFKEIEPQHAEQ